MTESKEKNGEVEILGNTIAEVVAEAVKHAPRGVFGISAGYITDKSELFSSDFEVRPEPITAEKIEQKLTSKLIMEAMLAGDDGRTVSRFVVALKLSK